MSDHLNIAWWREQTTDEHRYYSARRCVELRQLIDAYERLAAAERERDDARDYAGELDQALSACRQHRANLTEQLNEAELDRAAQYEVLEAMYDKVHAERDRLREALNGLRVAVRRWFLAHPEARTSRPVSEAMTKAAQALARPEEKKQ